MRRATLVNGALVALALGTLGVVWATRDVATTGELDARKAKLLVSFDEHAVTGVELQRDGQKLRLARDTKGEFRIEQPWQERADIATVKALLGSLELASALRPADGAARKSAGLDGKALEISVFHGEKRQILRLGGPAPAPAGARYLEVVDQAGERRLYTVSQGLADELDLHWDKFRETRLLNVGRSDLRELKVSDPRTSTSVTLVPSHGTFVTAHGQELVDGAVLERFLVGLSRLVSERFVEPAAARPALGTTTIQLKVAPDSRPPVSLQLGATCPAAAEQALVLVEQGESARAGCVAPEVVEALQLTSATLELKRPFSPRLDEVEELSLKQGDGKLELSRKESGFLLKFPTRGDVPLEAGNQRLGRILGAKGERIREPNLPALGLLPPAGEASIQIAGAETQQGRREVVQLGKTRADGSMCIKRETDAVVLCLQAADAAAFLPDASLLKSLELTSFGPAQLVAFSIETPDFQQRVTRKDDGGYVLEKPAGFQHDGALVSDVVQLLGGLRATRWVAAAPAPAHGLDAPRLRVAIEPAGGARRDLLVGAASDGGSFASLSPDPGVFLLPRSSVQQLEQPLLDRALCPVPRAELARIEVSQGQRTISLQSHGDSWEATGLDPARAQALAATLSALRADFAVHVGPAKPHEGLARPSLSIRYFDQQGKVRKLTVGARDTLNDSSIAYVRLEGVDATFALAATTLGALQDF